MTSQGRDLRLGDSQRTAIRHPTGRRRGTASRSRVKKREPERDPCRLRPHPTWPPSNAPHPYPRRQLSGLVAERPRHSQYVRGNSIYEPVSLVIMRARDGGRKRLVETHLDVISRISWQPRPQP